MSASLGAVSTPRKVEIAITGGCNLDCAYCYFADQMVARNDLTTEEWLRFFDQLGELGVMDATLTGGEVFTRRDIFTLLDGLIANRMRYRLVSNGTMITEKTIEEFEVGKRRLRLDSIQISVDGSSSEIHDLSRPKSYKRAIRGLRLLKEAGLPTLVRVTINRYNVDDLENIARLLLEEVGLDSFDTNEAYPCGATSRYEDGIRLTPEQRKQVMNTLLRLNEQYNGRINAQAGPLFFANAFKQIDAEFAAGTCGSTPGGGKLSACGGVFNTMAVLHDGTIVPCMVVNSLPIGNIKTDDFGVVWRDHDTMNLMRRRRDIPLGELETCKGCKYQSYCRGGCPGGAVALGLGLEARNPYDCFRVLRGEDTSVQLDGYEKVEPGLIQPWQIQ